MDAITPAASHSHELTARSEADDGQDIISLLPAELLIPAPCLSDNVRDSPAVSVCFHSFCWLRLGLFPLSEIKIHNQYVECNINRHLFSDTKKPSFLRQVGGVGWG